MRAFSSNCTAPPDVVAFVRSPNIRGTFDIIWSCLLVLIICTWSVLHLNVPAQSTVKPGTWAKYKRDIWRTGTKIMWMFITLIAPEYILGKAWSEYRSVKCLAKRFEVQSEIDDVPWTAMHTHFANMGGFTIKFNSVSSEAAAQAQREASEVELRDLPQLGSTEVVATPVAFYGDCADNNTIKRSQVLDTRLNWIPEKSDWVDCKVVHIDLNKLGVRTFVSAKATHKYAAWLSRVIGDTGWHLDATNSALVDSAIETFNLSHFDTRSEFLRFKENSIMWAWNVRSLRGNIWVLDANQLLLARELGIIDRLPFLASDDLGDRNKQDLFLKVMALGQIGWFVLQIAVRLHLQLPTTLLEVMVLAFAACTVITYYLLLDKPNNASYSITLPASRYPQTVADIVRLAACGPVTDWLEALHIRAGLLQLPSLFSAPST
ncbi:uncharacterized protein PgNI_00562 [Pyricularia grisea]|uniref:Uncharacterized protein n=1 Tax=Pyricularia grisea TaxID=148305 RepID=A0A6P8BHJ0_PYRGI|nr:uncharacterized protein PgNI_00562 [Pyricularia grisea]TLD16238.1 hypothetical protein PgNI_00562 [Pyricularia grisea]